MNKYQEALQHIVPTYVGMTNVANDKLCERFQNQYLVFRKVLEELVDKATPKKLYTKANMTSKICPSCHLIFALDKYDRHEKHKYCPSCGQALDWSEDE